MMYQCGHTSSNICATVVEDAGNVGGCVRGEGVRWEISAPPTRFSCEPKTTLSTNDSVLEKELIVGYF